MKLTKKVKAEIEQAMNDYWQLYFKADLEGWANYLVDDYRNIGTTEEEIWHNKKEIVDYTDRIIDQLEGVVELRDKSIDIIPYDPYVMVHECGDMYFKVDDEWTFYQKLRLSSLIQKIDQNWKVLHQHGSFPDSKTQEGEAIGTDALKAENEKLLEAVKKRTAELELKNRELEIESALQRIRAQVASMEKSEDLLEIVVNMRHEFVNLGHEAGYFWHMRWLPEKYQKAMTSGDGTQIGTVMELPRRIHSEHARLAEWEKSDDPIVIFPMDVETTLDYVHKMGAWGDFERIDPNMPTDDVIREIGGISYVMARTSLGEIGYSLPGFVESRPQAELDILVRFARAFDLAHKRFEDLKKSEEQAKETLIELALEKVRSRTMAMRHSDELQEASFLLDQQVRELGIATWGCAFNIYRENDSIEWFGNEQGVLPTYTVPREGIFKKYYDYGQKGNSLLIQEFKGDECIAHYEYMSTLPVIGDVLRQLKETNGSFPNYQIDHVVYFKYGYLLFITIEHVPEAHDIFKRFTKVFEQTYTRFLDLQKAEAQAREAQIEAALERVRSRSMAMHQSNELKDVIQVVFEQMVALNIPVDHTGFIIDYKERDDMYIWLADDQGVPSEISIPYFDSPHWNSFVEAKKTGSSFFANTLSFEEKNKFYDELFELIPEIEESSKEFYYHGEGLNISTVLLDNVGLYIENLTDIPYTEEENDTLMRFGKVFQQTYTRFLDLQKAEAQVRDAQIEAALERVRSRSLAMHNSSELAEAAELLYKEFFNLGIPPFSCGYLIHDDEKKEWQVWLTNPGETSFKEFWTVPDQGDSVLKSRYQSWQNKEAFHVSVLEGKPNIQHHEFIIQYAPWKKEMLDDLPPRLVLNSAHFTHGHLLVISPDRLSQDIEEIMCRFANVFDQTYIRFLDLQTAEEQAELARKQSQEIEKAYENLKATQAQLIQAEKMASLGELTAGIAHEIQNPLNFVNNFSDVNTELIEELIEEISSTPLSDQNLQEAKELAADIKANEEKIKHHGSRADSIVKGMLQHSRTNSGEKVPTDINALADEYLRLAYHGLRAKDNTFNAKLETDFEDSLVKIQVIPQDIGRVLLNLITNAFQACAEKNSLSTPLKGQLVTPINDQEKYRPKVFISTERLNNSAVITISDNGPGIPKTIIDKIFQPFFTTKPTGEGTGLGLSLAYDIVQAHGGELTVQSEEGKGTVFKISLPVVN